MLNYHRLQEHEDEVRQILKDHGALDSKGRIRRWSSMVFDALKEAGHTSLSPTKCQCQNE